MSSNPGSRAARVIAVACVLALSAAACARQDNGAPATAGGRSSVGTGAIGPVPTSPGTVTPTGDPTESNGGSSGQSGATRPPSKKPGKSPSAAAGPQIVYFRVSGNASCAESGPGFSAPGTVTLTWKVTGTGTVALSLDNPGFFGQFGTGSFGTYPAQDTQTLPFSCDTSGQRTTHQYTLDTIGGGAHRSMTVKATATSHA